MHVVAHEKEIVIQNLFALEHLLHQLQIGLHVRDPLHLKGIGTVGEHLVLDIAVEPLDDGDHGDHGGHANDNAQQGEKRAQFVCPQGAQRENHRFGDIDIGLHFFLFT